MTIETVKVTVNSMTAHTARGAASTRRPEPGRDMLMSAIHDHHIAASGRIAGNVGARRWRPADLGVWVAQNIRLWCARHLARRELAMMSAGDLKDACLPSDLVAFEVRKWPWQKWHPQWKEMDEMLLRKLAARRPARVPISH